MLPVYDYGDGVRLIRNVRNDGTYPGMPVGELLVRRGSLGCVHDIGTYLQDQLIYRVHFLDCGRTVGCRAEELQLAEAPWVNHAFEFRDQVQTNKVLAIQGEVRIICGQVGSVEKVLRSLERGVHYHVRFGDDQIYQVPESALTSAGEPS
ncbi:MAG: nitrogen fixation protein NifZ [Pseudomonadales bacterium]|nr:nitrogen fixation protein NifZ [Pseudomonadales bacterium]